MSKCNLGKKGFVPANNSGHSPSSKETREGTQDRNLEARTEPLEMEEGCFLAYTPLLAQLAKRHHIWYQNIKLSLWGTLKLHVQSSQARCPLSALPSALSANFLGRTSHWTLSFSRPQFQVLSQPFQKYGQVCHSNITQPSTNFCLSVSVPLINAMTKSKLWSKVGFLFGLFLT